MIPSFPGSLPSSNQMERRAGYDVWLLAVTLVLCTCGAIFVWTSSAAHSWSLHGVDSTVIFRSHVGRLVWGLVCMFALSFVDYHVIGKMARGLIGFAFLSLIVVLIIPQPAGATAHRWIYFHGFSFQPAELAKFSLINYLALRFGARKEAIFAVDRKKLYWGSAVVAIVTISLILLEPNYSMVALVLATSALLFFLAEIPLKPFLILGGAIAVPLAFVAWFTAYMRTRLLNFADGIVDPMRASYHVKQSLIGIGQGGITGVGLGASTQKHFFLPEPYKDFIYSIVGEELGLIGAVLVLAAFVLLLARCWRITRNAPDGHGYYLAAGITCTIALSLIVNVGVTIGLLPATGQPLPFISYGGSSLMMTLGAIGVLLNISKQTQRGSDRFDQLPQVS